MALALRDCSRGGLHVKRLKPLIAALLCIALAMPASAQSPTQQPRQSYPAPASSAETKTFSQAELDQAVAPIALYPDALLAQVLVASTYPIEVVYADRCLAGNARLNAQAVE